MAENEKELKNLLMKVKEESKIVGLKAQHSKNKDPGIQSHHFMTNRWGNNENRDRLFSWAPKSLQMVTAAMKLRRLLLGREAMTNLDSILISRDITFPTKVCLVKGMVFPVVMYGCESWNKESWVPKHWCFWTVVLEKTLESPLDCKEIQPVHPKGAHWKDWCWSWNSILWPPHVKSWLIGKDPDAGKNWRREEKDDDRWDGWIASPTQ